MAPRLSPNFRVLAPLRACAASHWYSVSVQYTFLIVTCAISEKQTPDTSISLTRGDSPTLTPSCGLTQGAASPGSVMGSLVWKDPVLCYVRLFFFFSP